MMEAEMKPYKKIRDPHIKTSAEICSFYSVSSELGLTSEQVSEAHEVFGYNELVHSQKKSFLSLVLEQFQDLLTRILLLAACISFALALISSDSHGSFTAFVEPVVILLILIANAVVSIWQESTAEKSLEALKKLQPDLSYVLRDGQWQSVPSKDLVPGDICIFHVGDRISADFRVLHLKTISFRVEQSQLTGEPHGVPKEAATLDANLRDCEIQAKRNILFASTTVAHGSATAIVVATGMDTEIGIIQQSVQAADEESEQTPLQQKLDEFGALLSKVIGVICVIVWVINIKNFSDPSHGGFFGGSVYYFKTAIALAVAAIPEGLTAVITTCLALGTRKLAQKSTIVRRLTSVETLGCTTVICSDKTGTLTTNQMRCVELSVLGEDGQEFFNYTINGHQLTLDATISSNDLVWSSLSRKDEGIISLIRCAALCNNASLKIANNRIIATQGEPTEVALKILVEQVGCPEGVDVAPFPDACSFWASEHDHRALLEFTRDRKSMSVLVESKTQKNQRLLLVKGAPELLLDRCSHYVTKLGKIKPLSQGTKQSIQEQLRKMTKINAQRVLGFAYTSTIHPELIKYVTEQDNTQVQSSMVEDPSKFAMFESNLTFCGLAGLFDPPRPEVSRAVASCADAGIKVVMITGDNKNTAEAIAVRIGIIEPSDLQTVSFSGKEFELLSESQKRRIFTGSSRGAVFSRTEPKHKQMIIRLLKDLGEITAMTGDGVNDAPALKQADIGIAMGISGTEVAKEASDMILADDNFMSIVEAVKEGRSIYDNMRAFIRYLISSNIGEVASIFLTAALGIPESFLPVQLLWVNLVTDGLPATALGFNPPDPAVMQKSPRRHDDPLITPFIFLRYLIIGIYVGIATVGIFIAYFVFQGSADDNHSLIPYTLLSHWNKCHTWSSFEVNLVYNMDPTDPCTYFTHGKIKASTLSLTVLVVIEMLNALNALSERSSLLTVPPWSNPWLLLAIAASIIVHMGILYIDFFAKVFGVVPLTVADWIYVLLWSLPVLLIDEILKALTRSEEKILSPRAKKKAT